MFIERRLQKELQWIKEEKMESFREIDTTNLLRWKGLLVPTVAPYNKEALNMEIIFPDEYPFKQPAITFITQINHIHVNESGKVNMEKMRRYHGPWSPAIRVIGIIHALLKLLDEPNEQKRRLQKELQWIKEEKMESFWEIDTTNPFSWKGLLLPIVAPYNKGAFRLLINFPDEYPFIPLRIIFITKIYHPNVRECGNFYMEMICRFAGSWSPSFRVVDIIHAILNVLNKPDNHFLRPELFSEFQKNPEMFFRKAEEFTKIFAETRPLELSEEKRFLAAPHKILENTEEQSKKIMPDQPEGKCGPFVEDSTNKRGVSQSTEETVKKLPVGRLLDQCEEVESKCPNF